MQTDVVGCSFKVGSKVIQLGAVYGVHDDSTNKELLIVIAEFIREDQDFETFHNHQYIFFAREKTKYLSVFSVGDMGCIPYIFIEASGISFNFVLSG